jgi:hypothetical protein
MNSQARSCGCVYDCEHGRLGAYNGLPMRYISEMPKREIHILSYFSLPTDLAGSMRNWPEFRRGEQYSVDFESENGEVVSVRFQSKDDEDYVVVLGVGEGPLFDRVLGRVVYELGAHSDNLMIYRWNK